MKFSLLQIPHANFKKPSSMLAMQFERPELVIKIANATKEHCDKTPFPEEKRMCEQNNINKKKGRDDINSTFDELSNFKKQNPNSKRVRTEFLATLYQKNGHDEKAWSPEIASKISLLSSLSKNEETAGQRMYHSAISGMSYGGLIGSITGLCMGAVAGRLMGQSGAAASTLMSKGYQVGGFTLAVINGLRTGYKGYTNGLRAQSQDGINNDRNEKLQESDDFLDGLTYTTLKERE